MSKLPSTQEKRAYVHKMFGNIAAKYDLMNDLMTFGLHRLWKREVCSILKIQQGQRVLDLCCGTGDLTVMLTQNLQGKSQVEEVIGLDFSEEMLSFARERKLQEKQNIKFIQGDALELPFPDNSFDRCSISFGLRNVSDYLKCLKEIFRVCKTGAKLVILDLSHPEGKASWFWDYATRPYRFFLLPLIGKLFAGDSTAYAYLPNSIKIYPNQESLINLMKEAGFEEVACKNLFGGLLAIHEGSKK